MLPSLVIILNILKFSEPMVYKIWNKNNNKFESLNSTYHRFISTYSEEVKNFENHNFQKENIKIVYYEEKNIFSFYDNDTKVTGVCGELWTMLANYLNFTLVPMKLDDRNFGDRLDNDNYTGMLKYIHNSQAQVIPRSSIFIRTMTLLDYTIPLWTLRYHFYIKPEWKHDEVWMFHLLSKQMWCSIIVVLLALSVAGYVCEKYSTGPSRTAIHFNIQEHILYTFAIASAQGCLPRGFCNNSKIIYALTSMFSYIVLIAFSSHAIFLMMHKKYDLPFTDFESLIQKTDYDMIAFSGSSLRKEFRNTVSKFSRRPRDLNRIFYSSTAEKIYEKVCYSGERKLAAFEAEDRYKAIGKSVCTLISTRESYFGTWVSSAVKRGFRYKRSFDVGILKFYETGLMERLKDKWLNLKFKNHVAVPFQSVDISQVYLIFGIWCLGVSFSIFILLMENMINIAHKIVSK